MKGLLHARRSGMLALLAWIAAFTWLATGLVSVDGAAQSSFEKKQNPFLQQTLPPSSQQAILASVLSNDETLSSCKPTGQISDARCDYETVEMDINSARFFPILDNLRRERYFRLYKVDLYKDCPFWNDNSLCMSRDCTVSKVDEAAIPEEYQSSALSSVKMTNQSDLEAAEGTSSASSHDHDALTASEVCQCAETDFCHWEDEEWSPESSWVDLLDNPERFTGYSGTSAQRVWRAIYEENCFGVARAVGASMTSSAGASYNAKAARLGDPGSSSAAAEALSSLLEGQSTPLDTSSSESEQCLEKRVFYKIISGLHASISIHICHDYLDQQTGEWKPNLACFVERIAQHPDRLQNLYFTHTVLVRSLAKLGERMGLSASPASKQLGLRGIAAKADKLVNLAPGLPSASSTTSLNLASLLQQALNSPPTFDEASMFDKSNPESEFLRSEFRDRFRNVSRIMDCVGCDKCRLWGKLQVNGLGTALKILFEGNQLSAQRLLQRSELVALINTVHRISESIRAVESFRSLYQEEVERQQDTRASGTSKAGGQSLNKTLPNVVAKQNDTSKSTTQSAQVHTIRLEPQHILTWLSGLVRRGMKTCGNRWNRCIAWLFDLASSSSVNSNGSKNGRVEL